MRKYVRSDAGAVPALATRLAGSSDLYQWDGRAPYHSINFVTCHDGFTMADLVCYNEKHNLSNGENNCDGTNDNLSWNCGIEGPSSQPDIQELRIRQVKNFATLLFMSHGVPMLLYGDEVGRSQDGNKNAYCHDGLSWMDWKLVRDNERLLEFFQRLIAFRRAHKCLRRGSFEPVPDEALIRMDWHGTTLGEPDWSWDSHSLALHLYEVGPEVIQDSIYLITHAQWFPSDFALPKVEGRIWKRFLDTSLAPPFDIAKPGQEGQLQQQGCYSVQPRSTIVLVGVPC